MRKTLIETYLTKGICSYIQEYIGLDWFTADMANILDKDLYFGRSTTKYISPLFTNLLSNMSQEEAMQNLAKNIILKFRENWDDIYKAYFETIYKPLENYSMVEQENTGVNVTVVNEGKNKSYGFNSVEGEDVSSGTSSSNTTSNFDDNRRQLTRSGNIGITTSQQMLQAELDLREYNFFDKILRDIDSVVCLGVYR